MKAAYGDNAGFVPILATANDRKISPMIVRCIEEADVYLGEGLLDHSAFESFREMLQDRLRKNDKSDWVSFLGKGILRHPGLSVLTRESEKGTE